MRCDYGHTKADHDAAGACTRPSLDARAAAAIAYPDAAGTAVRIAFERGWDAATAGPPTGEREKIPYMLENTREEFERVRDLAWPVPAAEPTAGLRERVAQWLARRDTGDGILSSWHEDADSLLAGPLADVVQEAAEADKRLNALIAVRAERDALLAKLQAVEALAEEWSGRAVETNGWSITFRDKLRRALDA